MSLWAQLNFQEGISSTIEILNYFHDYMILILIFILLFVSYVFVWIIAGTSNQDKNTFDSHRLEFIW